MSGFDWKVEIFLRCGFWVILLCAVDVVVVI